MEKTKVNFRWAFKEFIWPRRKIVSLGLLLIIIRSTAALVLPYASKNLIDEVIPAQDMDALRLLITVVCIALLLQSVSSFSLTRILSVEAQRLISILRARVQQKLLTLPAFSCNEYSYHSEIKHINLKLNSSNYEFNYQYFF